MQRTAFALEPSLPPPALAVDSLEGLLMITVAAPGVTKMNKGGQRCFGS